MRRPRGSKKGATSVWARSLSGTAEIRTVSHYFAPYRAAARILREPLKSTNCTSDLLRATPGSSALLLASNRNAQGTHVAAAVKGPQRDSVLASSQ